MDQIVDIGIEKEFKFLDRLGLGISLPIFRFWSVNFRFMLGLFLSSDHLEVSG